VGGKPLFYVYDSYHIDKTHWATLLTKGGAHTVRGTALDGVFLGLWLDRVHGADLKEGGFDGFYTYVYPVGMDEGGGGSVCVFV
jgi:glycoprotein endo-alpha-1,2-mannosidase